jgi:hypothetical protein
MSWQWDRDYRSRNDSGDREAVQTLAYFAIGGIFLALFICAVNYATGAK